MASTLLLLLTFAVPLSAAEPAALRIESQPGVEVIWEGVSLGSTDTRGLLVVEEIPPGRYTIALRKEGFRETSREIELLGGETNSFRLDLARIEPPSPRAQAAPPKMATRAESTAGGAGKQIAGPANREAPPAERPSKPVSEPAAKTPIPTKIETDPAPAVAAVTAAPPAEVVVSETPGAVADPAAAGRTDPPSGAGRSWQMPLLVLALLAFGTGLFCLGRFRAKVFFREWDDFTSEVAAEVEKAVVPPPPGPESWEPSARAARTVSPELDEPAFIEDLKRREKSMQERRPRNWRRSQPEVIDADFIEVLDAEVDA